MADPKLTPDVPWPDDHVQLTTAEAKLAVLTGDHPEVSSFKVDTALVDMLNRGLAVCARAPDRRLSFRPSMASNATELDPRLVGEVKLQYSVRGEERKKLKRRLRQLKRELRDSAALRSANAEHIRQLEQQLEDLKGGEETAVQEAQEAAPITGTESAEDGMDS